MTGELRTIQTVVVDPTARREALISARTKEAQSLVGRAGFEGSGVSLMITGIGSDGTQVQELAEFGVMSELPPATLAEYAAFDRDQDLKYYQK